MKQTQILFLVLIVFSTVAFGQSKKAKMQMDQKAIKSMCGCYDIKFNFAETFNYSEDPEYMPSKTYLTGGLEWAQLVVDENDEIVIQHLLVMEHEGQSHVIKHWRQDWKYENTDFYMFDHDNKWKYVNMPKADVKGQWTQKVYQVDDSPRYEGSASWVHVDGKSYWENTTDAPLPRREYTKRSDYNVTIRGNRHEITPTGWIHDQDNGKVMREEGKEDFLLAQEKGINTYTKVADSKCQAAIDWWKENGTMWNEVRANWDNVFAQKKNLKLKSKVDGKRLYQHLFSMEPASTKETEIKEVITSFVER
ncbi:MAG: DUF6607 family protein [Bacteroidota bacterium]